MFGGVVEEVGCSDVLVFFVVYDRGLEDVEREEIDDFLRGGILEWLA
jgi:hypothetical protein